MNGWNRLTGYYSRNVRRMTFRLKKDIAQLYNETKKLSENTNLHEDPPHIYYCTEKY